MTSVAAGLCFRHRVLGYYTTAEAPAFPLQLHLSLELLLYPAATEQVSASSAHLSWSSSLCCQNCRQLLQLISVGWGCMIHFILVLNKTCICLPLCHPVAALARATLLAQENIGSGQLCSSTCEHAGGNLHSFFTSIAGQASVTSEGHIRGISQTFPPGSDSVTLHKMRLWEVLYHVTAG